MYYTKAQVKARALSQFFRFREVTEMRGKCSEAIASALGDSE